MGNVTPLLAESIAALPDPALLAAVARGDPAALGELARRYVDFVYASAVRQLGDPHAAEDVAQAVFLVLAKKAGRVRAPALAAWLHQTTVYAANNARRAARRRRRHELAAAKPEAAMSAVPPDAHTLELLARLDDAIAGLSEKDRIAICGRYLRGDDLPAVAVALGITPAAAQKRIERAVEALRRRLTPAVGSAPIGGFGTTTLLAALTLAAPSSATAAPQALTASAASPAAVACSKAVLLMTLTSKIKIAGLVLPLVLLAGLGAEGLRRWRSTAAGPASVSPPTTAATIDPALIGRWEPVRIVSGRPVMPTAEPITIAADGEVRGDVNDPDDDRVFLVPVAGGQADEIDLMEEGAPGPLHGRYALDGDRLRLRVAYAGGPRPEPLNRADGNNNVGEIEYRRAAAGGNAAFTATFADGVSIELVAIGEPSTGQWWTPSGAPTTQPDRLGVLMHTMTPDPGGRVLCFVTEIHGADADGIARGYLEPAPERPQHASWISLAHTGKRRDVAQYRLDPGFDLRGFRAHVAADAPQSVSLRPTSPGVWDSNASVTLNSPGGKTFTLSNPHEVDGHPAFDISPYEDGQFLVQDLTLHVFHSNGEDWPTLLEPQRNAKPMKLEAKNNRWRLAEIAEARLTLRRFDRQADFFGFATRPGEAATPMVLVHEPPPRDVAK